MGDAFCFCAADIPDVQKIENYLERKQSELSPDCCARNISASVSRQHRSGLSLRRPQSQKKVAPCVTAHTSSPRCSPPLR